MNLSIIIPVFNSSDLLARLLYSIFERNMECVSLQIVIVDDGSKVLVDNELDEIKKIALIKNIELIVIRQQNAGPAVARNTGLNYAKGDYIWFCDADDYILGECFTSFVRKYPFQILEFGYYDESIKYYYIPDYKKAISTLDYLKKTDGRFYLWNKVFHKSVLKNQYFDERLLSLEDYIYCIYIFSRDYYITPLQEVFYEYKFNEQSITKKIDEEKKIKMSYNTFIVHQEIIKIMRGNQKFFYIFERLLAISLAGYIFSLIKLKYQRHYFVEAFHFYLNNNIRYISPFYFFNFRQIKLFIFVCLINIFLIIFLVKKKIAKV